MMEGLEIGGIFAAGLLTFVTPCVLPLIPVYLALLVGNASTDAAQARTWRARLTLLSSTLLFSAGMIIVFVGMGLTATALGRLLVEYRTELVMAGGLLIFLFGLKFIGVLDIPWLEREKRIDDDKVKTRSSWINALLMGIVFSLGWTPCVGPILGSVLTFTAANTSDPLTGAAYLAAYGLGFTLPLIVLSLLADTARRVVSRASRWLPMLSRASGVLLAGVGLYLMFSATSAPEATRTAPSPTAKAQPAVKISPPLGEPSIRPRMVQFSASSCSVCRQMISTVALIERDCDGRKVDVIKVDVDASSQNRSLAKRYRVRGVPTFVFLSEKGKEIARLVGYQKLPSLRQALAAVVGEQCQGLGLFETTPAECSDGAGATCDQS